MAFINKALIELPGLPDIVAPTKPPTTKSTTAKTTTTTTTTTTNAKTTVNPQTSPQPLTTAIDLETTFSDSTASASISTATTLDPSASPTPPSDQQNAGGGVSASTYIVASIFGVALLGTIIGLFLFRRYNDRKRRNKAYYGNGVGFERDERVVHSTSNIASNSATAIALEERQRFRDSFALGSGGRKQGGYGAFA